MPEPHTSHESAQRAGRLRCLADFAACVGCPQGKQHVWLAMFAASCIGSQLCTAVAVQGVQPWHCLVMAQVHEYAKICRLLPQLTQDLALWCTLQDI